MAAKENPLEIDIPLFLTAITGIRNSGVEGVNQLAGRTINEIRNGKAIVVGDNPQFAIPTITELRMLETSKGNYVASIVFDAEKILGSSTDAIQSDVVRTIAVVDQVPFNRYERRYRAIYYDAYKHKLHG